MCLGLEGCAISQAVVSCGQVYGGGLGSYRLSLIIAHFLSITFHHPGTKLYAMVNKERLGVLIVVSPQDWLVGKGATTVIATYIKKRARLMT